MKTTFTTLLASICLLLMASIPPLAAQDDPVDFDYFYDNLAPYGDWIEVEDYGYCFRPFVAYENPEWQPYSEGSWAETEAGWTWISEEEFGWATYHYGRWVYVDTFWAWVPGYEWAPAWVSWRSGDEYVGWAPLPPEAHWSNDRGFDASVDVIYDIGPRYYNFIPIRFFGAPNCRPHLLHHDRNLIIIRETTNITHITYRESNVRINRIYNGGPRYEDLNRASEHDIRRLKLTQHRDRGDERGHHRDRIENDRFSVFAPSVVRNENRNIAPREVKMRANRDKVDRGWRGIDQNQASTLRQRIAEEKRPGSERRRDNNNNNNDRSGPDRAIPLPSTSEPRERIRNAERDMPPQNRSQGGNEGSRRNMPSAENRPDRKPSDPSPPDRVTPKAEAAPRDRSAAPGSMPRTDRSPQPPRNVPEAKPSVAPQNRIRPEASPNRGNDRPEARRTPPPAPRQQVMPQPSTPMPRKENSNAKRPDVRPSEPRQERPSSPQPSGRRESPSPAKVERREPERKRAEAPAPQQRQAQERPKAPDRKSDERRGDDERRRKKDS